MHRNRRPLAASCVLVIAGAGVLAAAVPAGAATAGRGAAGGAARHAAGTPAVRELISVHAAGSRDTYARLTGYLITEGVPAKVFGPWTARVGYNGIAPLGRKREGDGRTPSGMYGFSFFFGVQHKLAFSFPFRHAYGYDVWDDDPSSPRYNEWVNTRLHSPGTDPEPMHQVPAYDYAAVIAYNTRRVPGRGSAIFLHVSTGSATAGCVSLPRAELIRVLRWLTPADKPVIAISAG